MAAGGLSLLPDVQLLERLSLLLSPVLSSFWEGGLGWWKHLLASGLAGLGVVGLRGRGAWQIVQRRPCAKQCNKCASYLADAKEM